MSGLKGNQKRGSNGKFEANPVAKPGRSLKDMPSGDIARINDTWYQLDPINDELGECDTCGGEYELGSRDGRCGNCGDCGNCCQHSETGDWCERCRNWEDQLEDGICASCLDEEAEGDDSNYNHCRNCGTAYPTYYDKCDNCDGYEEQACDECGSGPKGTFSGAHGEGCSLNPRNIVTTKPDTNAIPSEYNMRDWAPHIYWPNVPEDERKAFAWAMESETISFYHRTHPSEENYDDDDDYPDYYWSEPDAAGSIARALEAIPLDADRDTVIEGLKNTPMGEYYYLAEPGVNHPALNVWEEWVNYGPRNN